MGVLISLLSLLLVAAAGGLRAAVAVSMDEAYYNSASEVKAYWKTALPSSPMPSAILEHLSAHDDGEKVTLQQSAYTKEGDEKATFQWGSFVKEDNDKITSQRDVRMKEGDGKIIFQWGPHNKGAQATFRQDPYTIEGGEKATFQWGPQRDLADEKVTFHWGPDMKEDDDKASLQCGQHKVSDEKVTFRWGPQEEGNDGKVTVGWGPQRELGDEKATFGWGPNKKEDDEEATLRLGQHKVDDEKVTFRWGPNIKQDDGKVTLRWGQHKDSNKKIIFWWGPQEEGNDEEVTLRWGSNIKEDNEKVTFGWAPRYDEKVTSQWGPHTKIEDDKVTFLWSSHKRREDERDAKKFSSPHQKPYVKEEHHQWHGTGHNHGQINLANLLFSEAVLTPGTMVTPYIESSVLPTPFLRRDVADSIPVSTKNFTDILALFMPMSFAMAGRIWSTLNTCEHPHPLEGEQQACATSIESMVELATSVLGTRDVRAFSSSLDVPAEGVASPSSRHTVAAVRAVTAPGEAATTITCHGATFPYAVFYCHAVNPTRVYDVTLRRAEEDSAAAAAPATTMQVLAVCHLDTSQFDPENPFFVERGLKPGDASVCHFLSRDSVLWAPAASTKGYEQVTAQ